MNLTRVEAGQKHAVQELVEIRTDSNGWRDEEVRRRALRVHYYY